MPLLPGTHLGPYEVVSPLGAGGMGEVYRARDTRLNRDVALKILPEQFAGDPERVARFEREAHLLASLNHAHIAQIYGVDQTNGVRALAMELVDGETLADVIRRHAGAAPAIDDCLRIARQIADALDAAHEKGIIHRDLKPGNVMITSDGQVKLLDFGLGKTIIPDADGDLSNSPTMVAAPTQVGMLLGTAAYMAPEQAKGRAVDKRCDIWAFGCVLFELLSGKRAFEGEDVSETLAAILRAEPNWQALPADMPPHVRRLLHRCLEKDRKRRLRDVGDVLFELDNAAAAELPAAATVGPAPRRGRDAAWLAALVIAGAAVGGAVWWMRAPPIPPETRLEIVAPQSGDITFALSPSGRQLVFVAPNAGQNALWLRGLDATVARPLPGTEAGSSPFWSPDGQSIGFYAQGRIKRFDLATSAVRVITDAAGTTGISGAAWGASDVIIYKSAAQPYLLRISASGGEPGPATTLSHGATGHAQPQFLPDGRQFVFFCNGPENVQGLYLASLDTPETTRLTDADAAGRFVAPGWLAYVRQGRLVARRLDLARKSLSGDVVLIAENVGYETRGRGAAFSVSSQGLIAYRAAGASRRQLTWFDRSGKTLGALGPADDTVFSPELSPDGSRVAVWRSDQAQADIWVIDAQHATRFTFDPAFDTFPLWSPDGRKIAFTTARNGKAGLYMKSASGAGEESLLVESPAGVRSLNGSTSWSRDNRFILVDINGSAGFGEVWVLPLAGDKKPYSWLSGRLQIRLARFSPDDRWVAYESLESGRAEICVRPFPGPGGPWQVSTGGGAQPRWRGDGKELYWISPDAKLMAASMGVKGDSIEPGAPVPLFQTRIYLGGSDQPLRGQFTVAPDGRFLINTVVSEESVMPITIVQNWRER